MSLHSDLTVAEACSALRAGKPIVYPTEGVFGIGCDPASVEAVDLILRIKGRPAEKGLILVAASVDQLTPWVELSGPNADRAAGQWPGPVTWVFPVLRQAQLLSPDGATLAVRVSAHPVVQALCTAFRGAIVSTSANISGQPAARNAAEARANLAEACLADQIAGIVAGEISGLSGPTPIFHGVTGQQLR